MEAGILGKGIDSMSRWGSGIDDLDLSQSILFTNNPVIVHREEARVPLLENDLQFIDEGKHVTQSVNPREMGIRPMTTTTSR